MSEIVIERDIPILMKDGINLRADLFRPNVPGSKFPVVLTMGPYAKGLRYQDGYFAQWKWLIERHPEILEGSKANYMAWETVDPERWVPKGYAIVRVDSRGAGHSPGILDCFSPQETRDLYQCIEWAGVQEWSNGKVGLCGISYYAINQWNVASLHPPHLAAMIPWEGAADFYRDFCYHGGILCNVFMDVWYPAQVLSVQHGLGKNGPKGPHFNEFATGPETLSLTDLIANRADWISNIKKHKLDDEFHKSRSPDFSKIKVPFFSSANWGGFGLHPRGNFEGFTQAKSKKKWLEVHGGRHEENFYLPYALELQMRFFDYYLKGENNGWEKEQPPVMLAIRHVDHFETRYEKEWPLARTQWTKVYLNSKDHSLSWSPVKQEGKARFEALGEGLSFSTPPLEKQTEITGPLAAKLYISSTTIDADLFVTLLAFSPDNKEVEFQGTLDPHTPLAQGWLRASHRRIDRHLSKPSRPYHAHNRIEAIVPKKVYHLDIEIWPTCIVLPAGYRIALFISGTDFQRKESGDEEQFRGVPMRGSGPFLHNSPDDRPKNIFGGKTTIYSGPSKKSHLLLPIVPNP
jgi:predicted acyl esterase